MPFVSQAQRKFMFSQHPEIAKEFAAKSPDMKDLPVRKKKKKVMGQMFGMGK
jgi:hypothetical protein